MDFDDLTVLLAESNPVRAINGFVYINSDIPLENPHLEKVVTPLEALKGVLRILLVSDRSGL